MSILPLAQGAEPLLMHNLRTFAGETAVRYRRWRLYRTSVAELSSLSGRELADLGLNRGTIRSAAREAVYGAN